MLRIFLAFILYLLWTAPAWCALPTVLWKVGRTYRAENKTDATEITIAVRLTKPDAQDVTATITATGANTAAVGLGKDLTLSATTVTIPAGALVPVSQPTVTIVNNPTLNLDRLVTLTLTGASANARVSSYNRLFVNLVDDARSGIKDVPAPSGGDDTAAIQSVIDWCHHADRGADRDNYVVRFQPGTYLVDNVFAGCVFLYSGNMYCGTPGETTVIKRIDSIAEDAECLFTTNRYNNRANDRILGIANLSFDGNNMTNNEHGALIMFMVTSAAGEQLNCAAQDIILQNNPGADGFEIGTNVNCKLYNINAYGTFRGSHTYVGGNTDVTMKNFVTHNGDCDMELEPGCYGYGESYRLNLTMEDSSVGRFFDFGLGPSVDAVISVTRSNATHLNYNQFYAGNQGTFNYCNFNTYHATEPKITNPTDLVFNYCNFVYVKPDDETYIYPGCVPLIYTRWGNVGDHESITFNNCTFKSDGSVSPDSLFTGVAYNCGTGDSSANENKIIFNNCVFGDASTKDLNMAVRCSSTLLKGGWVKLKDCTLNLTDKTFPAGDPFYGWEAYPIHVSGDQTYPFYLELDNVTFNTNRFLLIVGNYAENVIKITNVAITKEQNLISGDYSNITFDSAATIMRTITGTGDPNGTVKGFCNSGATKYDQYHDTASGKYYKCTEVPTTWTEYTP